MRLSLRRVLFGTVGLAGCLAVAWLTLGRLDPAAAAGPSDGTSTMPSTLPIPPPVGPPSGGGISGTGGGSLGGGSGGLPPRPPGDGSGCCAGSDRGGAGEIDGGIGDSRPDVTGGPPLDVPAELDGAPLGGPSDVPNQVVAVFRSTSQSQIGESFAGDHGSTVIGYFRLARLGLHVFLVGVDDPRQFQRVFQRMSQDARPLWIQRNFVFETSQSSTAALAPSNGPAEQYALDRLRVAPVLNVTRGAGVKVAIVDSGVAVRHEALAGARISVIDVTTSADAPVAAPTAELHGTAVAGIIVGQGKLRGVSPEVELLAIRAFKQSDSASGAASSNSFHLSKGISTAIDRGARVINLSLAGPQDRLVAQTVEQALMSKIAVIAAAGNGGRGAPPAYPAAQPGVIAVTATDGQDRLYRHANRGSYVTLAAPGVDIPVAQPDGYGHLSGTSMATAYVSGLSALMIARAADLTPTRLRKLLEETATDLGAPQRDPEFGAGRVDATAAFNHLAEN